MNTQRMTIVAVATAMLIGLAGCSLVEAPGTAPLTGIAACALGKTWSLDTAKLAQALQDELATRGVTATVAADGTQSIDWAVDGKIKIDTKYTVTYTTGADASLAVITDEHSGVSTGIAYINAEVAIPRDWDATGLNVKTSSTLAGVAAETLPYTILKTDIDDSVGVELTCDGGTMTTHQRGTDITLTWTAK